MLPVAILNIGTFEMLVLAAAAVLLFGGDLPETARKTARLVSRVRSMMHDVTRELNAPTEGRRAVDIARDEIRSVVAEVKTYSPFAEDDEVSDTPGTDAGPSDLARLPDAKHSSDGSGEPLAASTDAPELEPKSVREESDHPHGPSQQAT